VDCPNSRSGRNTLMAPALPAQRDLVAWPAEAIREDPIRLLPWRLPAQPPPYYPAGHADPQHRQHHADGMPRRSTSQRYQRTGQGPYHGAMQQPGQLGLSRWLPVGVSHGASRGQRGTVQGRRWLADGLVRNCRQAAQRQRGSRGQVVVAGCRRRVAGDRESTTPKRAQSPGWALQRHLAPTDATGRPASP
jgi:hypothetical protein